MGGAFEILRQSGASVKYTVPLVFVLSVYSGPVPSALHVPVTVSCPADMGAVGHPKPVMSTSPLNVRHDDVTFQVPVTSPLPQSVVLGQLAAPPVAGPLPPVAGPLLPPFAVEEAPPLDAPPADGAVPLPPTDELPPDVADVLLPL